MGGIGADMISAMSNNGCFSWRDVHFLNVEGDKEGQGVGG